ncbi:MAG: tRNA pseudouridine(13) synthase TruD [Planctomycetota bacterium]|nr:tRNA pseudouridine(13) synthase TruD [Planctomycetota bacterium]
MSIKRSPADFIVDELLKPGFRPEAREGPFAVYRLSKEGMATPEAVGQWARKWKIKPGALAYAGLKDKYARCTQHVSLRLALAGGAPPERDGESHWNVERLGWAKRHVQADDLAGNRFRIVVRGLHAAECAGMDRAIELLRVPDRPALRFVNYFGDQRFGSARHGQGFVARLLVDGDFEGALQLALCAEARKDRREVKAFKRALTEGWGRWQEVLPKLRRCPERRAIEHLAQHPGDFRGAFGWLPYFLQQMCVYAYQSHLWNAVARGLAARCEGSRSERIVADDPFGVMLFPAAAAVPAEWAELDVPLLSRKTEMKEPWAEVAREVLEEEGLDLNKLRIPGVRRPFFGETPRRLFAEAAEFSIAPPVREGQEPLAARTLEFVLPPGAYATVLLRALGQ